MPGFCTPWPGNSNAIGPLRLITAQCPVPEVRRIFAASAAGAKETTSTRGSASHRCVTERAQESTPASAPFSGSPRNRQIPWGESAPGRPGREDARNFGCWTLLYPGHQTRPPGQPRAEAGQQDMVSTLHPPLPDRFLQRQRNRSAGGVAVLVDVDRHPVEREPDAPRSGVDDAEVGLVRDPQVDVLECDARGIADLIGLADEDVDRELEDVGADHVDERGRVLGRIRALLDVAASDLRIAAAVGPEAPAL